MSIPWFYYALGFLAFPIVGFALLALNRRWWLAQPVQVTSVHELQARLRVLLERGKHLDVLFIVWLPHGFQIRAYKRVRGTDGKTLSLEIRPSEVNREHYEAARDALQSGGVELVEMTTPDGRPRRLRMTLPWGGPSVVSAASHAISLVESSLPQEGSVQVLASRYHPSRWNRDSTAAA